MRDQDINDDELRKNLPVVWQEPSLYPSTMAHVSVFIKPRQDALEAKLKAEPGFTSLGALLEEPEEKVNWVVDGLLPSGGLSIIVAKPKVGKSTIVRELALRVARGEPFWGRPTTPGPVLYVALEEKRSEVRNHFRDMGAAGTEDIGIYVGSAPKNTREWLEHEVKSRQPVLIIIDTLFRWEKVREVNDYAEVTEALTHLLELARKCGAHVMVLHHSRKGGGDGGDVTLGSTAIFGSVDTAIILRRTDGGQRTIETQQRYGKDIEPTMLEFDIATRTSSIGGTRENADALCAAEEILQTLESTEEPLTEPQIAAEIEGWSTAIKRRALRELVKSQKITRTSSGKKGDPYLYSCLLVPAIYTGQEKQKR